MVATTQWRLILAEGHAFASQGARKALEAMDNRRSELVSAINESTNRSDLLKVIWDLGKAQTICDDFRSYHARQFYRELQVEKFMGDGHVFKLAHLIRLRKFAKGLESLYSGQIAEGQTLIKNAEEEHDQGARSV